MKQTPSTLIVKLHQHKNKSSLQSARSNHHRTDSSSVDVSPRHFLPFRTNTSENREITRARVRVASSTDASARNQRALYSLSLSTFFSSRDRYQRTRATGANCEHCKPILRIARCRGRGADNGMMEVGGGGGGGGGVRVTMKIRLLRVDRFFCQD